jgi:hypothetical protein
MRTVQIYVEDQRLELFADETMTVNSSTQNIYDIALTFTDISRTFTIPATPHNNAIFEHYYNNDLDTTINHSRRRNARIEIDLIPFRTGRIQLEKSAIKNGNADYYTVTFYGDFVSLKDVILEDKLKDLDYTTINHEYTGAEIQARIEDYDANVQYPLITSGRVWQYGDSTTNDISIVGGAIEYTELFPAVSYSAILELIQTKYGITFTGSFINSSPRFLNAYLWYKNKERFQFFGEPSLITFAGTAGTTVYDNEVLINYADPNQFIVAPYDAVTNVNQRITVKINTSSSSSYMIDIYKNGILVNSINGTGTTTYIVLNVDNLVGLSDTYYFKLRSDASMSFDADITQSFIYTLINYGSTSLLVTDTTTDNSGTITTSTNIDLSSLAPDMKVLDLISGMFRQFNLVCYGDGVDTYRIEPLEDFYNSGVPFDITKHTSSEVIEVNRPSLFNNISFEYEKSLSFMNMEFNDLFTREYGSLRNTFGYDGGDYTIKLPFESLLFSKFTGTNIQVGYCLGTEPEYKNYVPKPVSLYRNEKVSIGVGANLKFDNGTSVNSITNYVPFGQDTDDSDENYSLNFGSDISSYTLNIENNSLYKVYYQNYLINLFNPKTRLVSVTANLPLNILESLRLKDSVIIREKKYIINDMTTNLVSGEVKLNLISNWRATLDYGAVYNTGFRARTLYYNTQIPEGVTLTLGSPYETQFATPSATTLNAGDTLTFNVTQNLGAARTNTFPVTVTSNGVTIANQFIIINQSAP